MDCNKANDLIYKRMEHALEPAEAQGLHEHVMSCEDCREVFLVMDNCVNIVNSFDTHEPESAPDGFTKAVMAKVFPVCDAVEIAKTKSRGCVIQRVLWSVSAIIFGLAVYFLANPVALSDIRERFAFINTFVLWTQNLHYFITDTVGSMFYSGEGVSTQTLTASALLFISIMCVLLFALFSGDKKRLSS